ncbi:MAG: hypothetical protein R2795_07365 [Saprospiraceae bacterium]
MGAYQTLSQEYRVLEANNPTGQFRIIQPRERGLEYDMTTLVINSTFAPT